MEVAARWIPVDATTAERVDPAGVPDSPGGVRWTSAWPLRRLYDDRVDPIKLVAAGAGVVVASDDRIVAVDGGPVSVRSVRTPITTYGALTAVCPG